MNLLSAEKISKSYSEKILFEDISIGINEEEKIGLIGVNGTGKTTLLKVLAGEEAPDGGSIRKGSQVTVEYLPQNPQFAEEMTVLQQVFRGSSPVMELLREYEGTLQMLQEHPAGGHLEEKLLALTQKMDRMDAWTVENEAKMILTRLGINDFHADIGTLSGGQKKRVAMAGALIRPADLLILDEPTNHVDNMTVDWLEKYLNKRKGALLMVTHDRYFLDRVVNRIIELDGGRLFSYQANYSKFLEMKTEREEAEGASERKRQSLLKVELEWIRRGARARSTKQKARIERFEKLQEQRAPADDGNIEMKVGAARLGKKIIELAHIGKSFPGVDIIRSFDYIFRRGDRIGIIGPNGSGKSTLLRMIAGKLAPDSGAVIVGATVRIGFFSQESDEMNGSLRVIEYIREQAEYLETADGAVSASQMLERFLFPPAAQWTPVAKLSGGEKRRLQLLRVLMGAPNVLLLDEPTNDLDIQTLAVLESYLDDFPGAFAAVSHDRYFLDRVANKIFSFEGDGSVRQYEGNYSDYHAAVRGAEPEGDKPKGKEDKKESMTENIKVKPLKFSFKEQKEFEQIDAGIGALEDRLKQVGLEIDAASSDFERLQELLVEKEALEKQLEQAMERWVYLHELAEEIERNRKI